MREHIVAAAKAMKKGDWKLCSQYILAVKVRSVHWLLFIREWSICQTGGYGMCCRLLVEEELQTVGCG